MLDPALVSLINSKQFELASRLVGVYKVNHMVSLSKKKPSEKHIFGRIQYLFSSLLPIDEKRDGQKSRLYHRSCYMTMIRTLFSPNEVLISAFFTMMFDRRDIAIWGGGGFLVK